MAFSSDTEPRPLEYPLYNQTVFEVETPEGETASPFVWNESDPDVRIPIVLDLSLNEYIALATAIDVGSDIAYNEDGYKVWWIWIRCLMTTDLCDFINTCLAPQFEALNAKIDQLGQAASIASAQSPEDIDGSDKDGDYIYSACMAVVEAMHRKNVELYAEAEVSAADNVNEVIGAIISFFPQFDELPYGQLFGLSDGYFQNQVATYNADYPDFKVPAAFDLYCRVLANQKVFTYQVWGEWLQNANTLVYPNAAGDLYARYSPLSQTFFNQIAEFFNGEQSLQSYFNDLYQQYFAGLQSGLTLPEGYSCGGGIIYYEPNPPAPELYLDTDGGQFGYADARVINAPYTIAIGMGSVKTIQAVKAVVAFNTEFGMGAIIEGNTYDMVRGQHLGGETYVYEATVPDVDSDTIIIYFSNSIVISQLAVTVG